MLNNDAISSTRTSFNEHDIKTLIKHHIPLEFDTNPATAQTVIPVLLSLDGPEGTYKYCEGSTK